MTAMWNHYCPIEKADMKIGNGEPCNWCGLESGPIQASDDLLPDMPFVSEGTARTICMISHQ